MPNITAAAARRRLEQISPALQAGERPRSISFGLAELQPGDDLEQLVARADQALLSSRHRREVPD